MDMFDPALECDLWLELEAAQQMPALKQMERRGLRLQKKQG
jgi:hypothetical protein